MSKDDTASLTNAKKLITELLTLIQIRRSTVKVSLLWESTEPLSNPISEDSAFAHRSDSKADPEEPSVTRHNKKRKSQHGKSLGLGKNQTDQPSR